MALKLSERGDVSPFLVMEVMRAAAEREATGKDVLHLEVGQPGFPAPKGARLAAAKALETETLGYTNALGQPDLRSKIRAHYRDQYNLSLIHI